MLRPRDAEVYIVVTEIPQLVWADPTTTAGADRHETRLDATLEVLASTEVSRAVELALPTVPGQPQPSLLVAFDRDRFRPLSGISGDRSQSSSRGG
jgi:hypothetical protein